MIARNPPRGTGERSNSRTSATGTKIAHFLVSSRVLSAAEPPGSMFDELGTTPDAVFEALRARGIKGVRNTVRILNPIVRYVTSQFPDARSIDLILVDRLRIVFASGEATEEVVP